MQNSSLQKLLNDYGKRQVPSPSEELHWGGLVRRWLDHPDGPDGAPIGIQRAGRRGRDRLIEGNVRLVVAVAKKYCCSNYSDDRLMEAIQSGVLGLVRAVELFDPKRGYKLSTYSYFWITRSIQKSEENRGVVRLPYDVRAECRKIERAAVQLAEQGVSPSPERLAELTGIPLQRLKNRLNVIPLQYALSLDNPRSQDSDTSNLELIADPSEPVESTVELQAMVDWLEASLELLPVPQRVVMEGMLRGQDIKELAPGLRISSQAVRQRQHKAIATLRDHMEAHLAIAA